MVTATEKHEIAWSHDFDRELERARELHKPILLDFTAAPM
jgi:hypothetical protein